MQDSSQAMDLVFFMESLGVSQFVLTPMHQAGHMLELIFGMGIDMDLIAVEAVLWSDIPHR